MKMAKFYRYISLVMSLTPYYVRYQYLKYIVICKLKVVSHSSTFIKNKFISPMVSVLEGSTLVVHHKTFYANFSSFLCRSVYTHVLKVCDNNCSLGCLQNSKYSVT